MNTDNEQLENLCDTRKALIKGLSSMGLDAQQILDRLNLPYIANAHQYIEVANTHYDVVAECMSQCEALRVAPDDDTTQVYYFDWEEGVGDATMQMLMRLEIPYKGQKLVDDVKDIIPVILQPLMDEAIAEMNTDNINQLAEAMTYVIDTLIPQEQGNG